MGMSFDTDHLIKDMNILIVDDTADNLVFLKHLFSRKGFTDIQTIEDSRNVLPQIKEKEPDIILLDLMMPHLDGFDILKLLREYLDESVFLPIVVLTADTSRETRKRSLEEGAIDFLTKPLDAIEVLQRVSNLLKMRHLSKEQKDYSSRLELAVQERTQELNESYQILQNTYEALDQSHVEIVNRLAEAAEYRDDDTGQHTFRVGKLSSSIAAELGMSEEFVGLIRKAARLHDLGKIGVADAILLKPGKLTKEEFAEMKKHSEIGAKILSGGKSSLLQMAERIAMSHHEHWDGSGYPQGLVGEAIPIEARIVAVVDVFDALIHSRPYKKAWSQEEAIDFLKNKQGEQFDPEVVQAFLKTLFASQGAKEAKEASEVIPSDVTPSEVIPSEVIPTDVKPTDVIPSDNAYPSTSA